MSMPDVPMTIDELERLRQLLRKADYDKIPLSYEEQEELRELVAIGKPVEAKGAGVDYLIFLGLALLGLYVSILKYSGSRKGDALSTA